MKKIFFMVFTLAFTLQSKAQKSDSVKVSQFIGGQTFTQTSSYPLIVIDGNKQNRRGLVAVNSINPENILSINVLKDASASLKYGTDGNNGVIEIETKNRLTGIYKEIDTSSFKLNGSVNNFRFEHWKKSDVIKRNLVQKDTDPKARPLYVVDGEETDNPAAINPNVIKSITVLKDASVTPRYKEKGKHGVIIITTKAKTPTPEKN